MKNIIKNKRLAGTGLVLAALAIAAGGTFLSGRGGTAQAEAAAAAPAALPVSVSVVAPRQTVPWDEFSGRLEAVERVEIRSRVAGAWGAVGIVARGAKGGQRGARSNRRPHASATPGPHSAPGRGNCVATNRSQRRSGMSARWRMSTCALGVTR